MNLIDTVLLRTAAMVLGLNASLPGSVIVTPSANAVSILALLADAHHEIWFRELHVTNTPVVTYANQMCHVLDITLSWQCLYLSTPVRSRTFFEALELEADGNYDAMHL